VAKRKTKMSAFGKKTKEEIYAQMLKELRFWCPEVPESPDRLDPVIKLLLGSLAHQIEKLSTEIDLTWEKTFRALVRNMVMEGQRWPIPAHTVLKCEPTDKVVDIDTSVHFLYKEKKEEGKDFFFTPLSPVKLISAEIGFALFSDGKELTVLKKKDGKQPQSLPQTVPLLGKEKTSAKSPVEHLLLLGVHYEGKSKDFSNTCLFLDANPDALGQLRWGRWHLSSKEGYFLFENSFCPGENSDGLPWEKLSFREWGGLRQSSDLFANLFNQFFYLPQDYVSNWERCKIPTDVQKFISCGLPEEITSALPEMFWMKILLPEKGDKSFFKRSQSVHFNCFLAINKKEQTTTKFTAGNRLVEIELPEDASCVLNIDTVTDSNGREYKSRHTPSASGDAFKYLTEEKDNRIFLWFDFSNFTENMPNSITVHYSVTLASQANGIERDQIQQLYESHPGIKSATNLVPTQGGIPAKTPEKIAGEISSLLRNRGRAVSFEEIESWTSSFDPRIQEARCENVVQKGPFGARRVTLINIKVKENEFYSDGELRLLRWRLINFIKARSLINTLIDVNIKAE
jgi:hypothetical protein